jgi:hypothetical protein
MKSIKIYLFGTISMVAIMLIVSCTKTFDEKTVQQTDFSNSTLAQVFIATVGASRNTVSVDNKTASGLLTSGTLFPGAHGISVEPGLRSFLIKDTLRTSTQLPLAFAENMQPGKHYTIFAYDTITSPKQITVVDNIEIPADTTARLRFANFIHNSFAVPGIDVYSVKLARNIFTNVIKTQVTDFIPYRAASKTTAYISGSNDTLHLRETGSTTNIISINGFNPTEKRSYTIVYRGSHRGVRIATLYATR